MASRTYSDARPTPAADLRALWAVMLREWRIFKRYPSWIVALFIWPLIFPAAYILAARALAGPDGSGLALFARAAGTENYIAYIVVGTTIWMWQNVSLWTVGYALRTEQLRGTLETNWLTPSRRFWFLLGAGLTQSVQLAAFLGVSALEFGLFFGVRLQGNPWLVLLVFLAAIPATFGIGLAFASLVILAREANAFVFMVRGLVMVFCGITYPTDILPGWMQPIAAWLPPTYAIRGIRNAGLNNAGLAALLPDLAALAGFGVLWLVIGYVAFHWTERRARRVGSLGKF
ncbi:MAG: ABC transporter permease [Anaerolineales bacterium]|nr:ABC transporter permease [Anaerolineales bacterium]